MLHRLAVLQVRVWLFLSLTASFDCVPRVCLPLSVFGCQRLCGKVSVSVFVCVWLLTPPVPAVHTHGASFPCCCVCVSVSLCLCELL